MFEPSPTTGICAAATSAIAVACWWWSRRTLAGTTLLASCWWGIAAVVSVAACELIVGLGGASGSNSPLRFVAAVATFCPAMSVLGARRPHHGAWQFIVLSLWFVLALPAAEVFFLQRGQTLEIHAARSWFLLGLLVVGVANALPTRCWLAALLWGCGQAVLVGEYLPFVHRSLGTAGALTGLALLCGSAAANCLGLPNRRNVDPWNRLWLDFRDLFGALWGLRILERINATMPAPDRGWLLTWSGFHTPHHERVEDSLSPDELLALRQNTFNLLRRFVSPEWIATRLGESAPPATDSPGDVQR